MIPLKTLPDAKRAPLWTRVFALSIGLVWLAQLALQALRGQNLIARYGVRPACAFHPSSCGIKSFALPALHLAPGWSWAQEPFGRWLLSPLASLFLHGSWWHVGFNLLFLLVFGGAVESEVGRWKFVRLYLGGGLVATVCHVAFHPFSMVPTIGASGAIAAVLGAHFGRLPRAWVLTFFPPVFLLPVPGWLWGALWVGLQVAGALHLPYVASATGGDVAWMAHLGGFAWGWWASRRVRRVARTRACAPGGSHSP